MLYKSQLRAKRITRMEDGQLVSDNILIEVYTKDGKNYISNFSINTSEVPELISLLQEKSK